MKLFLIAVEFLTVFPVYGKAKISQKDLARSMALFPLVGLLIGCLLVVIDIALGSLFPDFIVSLLVVIALIIITGGLHLDGFTDTMDGIFSGQGRDRILEIMRDSRIGTFGVLGLICLLLLKVSFLNELSGSIRYLVLILMPIVSRWGAALLAKAYPYARKTSGAGQPFASFVGKKEVILASLFTVVLAGFLLKIKGIVILLVSAALLFLLGSWINKKINGMTGDIYGAIIEAVEVIVLISAYLIL